MDDKTHDQVLEEIFRRHDPQGDLAHLRAKHRFLDEDGRELPDPVPLAPPLGYNPQPSVIDRIREMVRHQLSEAADAQGVETFEDADDFEVGDDFEEMRTTPYEEIFEPTPARELRRRAAEAASRSSTPQPSSEAKPRAEGTPSGGVGGEGPPLQKDAPAKPETTSYKP